MMVCKECSVTFETEKSLHGHLRKHKLRVKEYYEKHYPRRCLQTGKKLEWKASDSLESYLSRDFLDKTSLNLYFEDSNDLETKKTKLLEILDESYNKHGIVPSQVELASLPLSPNLLTLQKYFNLKELFLDKKYKTRFNYNFNYSGKLPLEKINIEDFVINIDSREQNKYRIYNSIVGKLNVGDYCLCSGAFNGIVIERKSVADFGGTVVGGEERFKKELQRARDSEKYLIILVEFNIHDLHRYRFYGYNNPAFVSHNMRGLIRQYWDTCQFVFGIDRELCVQLVPQFLLLGQKAREIDLQLYVDTQKSQFKNHEFTKEDLINLYK